MIPSIGSAGPKGRYRQPAQSGFTLLELIVVVFIIGVIASFAVLSTADRAQDDRLHNETRRVYELLRLASDEAVLLGVELGLHQDKKSYRFIALDENNAWVEYTSEGPLRARHLPDGIKMQLETEEFGLPAAEETELLPHLLFLSSGEISPFKLQLTAEGTDSKWQITGTLVGDLDMQPVTDNRP